MGPTNVDQWWITVGVRPFYKVMLTQLNNNLKSVCSLETLVTPTTVHDAVT
jgi:hypothetical protein